MDGAKPDAYPSLLQDPKKDLLQQRLPFFWGRGFEAYR